MPRPAAALRVSEHIARRIKRQIASGQLTVGQRLPPEREMAVRHKSSRVSVREAYRSLEELGILRIRRGANGGTFIAEPGCDAARRSLSIVVQLGHPSDEELAEARVMMELTIVRLAARHARPADVARLRAIVDRLEAAVARHGQARAYDLLFQRALLECARNLPLTTLINALPGVPAGATRSAGTPGAVDETACRFHREIVEAIERHDEEAAHRLLLAHSPLTPDVWPPGN